MCPPPEGPVCRLERRHRCDRVQRQLTRTILSTRCRHAPGGVETVYFGALGGPEKRASSGRSPPGLSTRSGPGIATPHPARTAGSWAHPATAWTPGRAAGRLRQRQPRLAACTPSMPTPATGVDVPHRQSARGGLGCRRRDHVSRARCQRIRRRRRVHRRQEGHVLRPQPDHRGKLIWSYDFGGNGAVHPGEHRCPPTPAISRDRRWSSERTGG